MNAKMMRINSGILTGFTAFTAIPGGIVILLGVDEFPMEWLAGTPFSDYTVPALILSVVGGGSALVACIMILRKRPIWTIASMIAGLIMMGQITGEMILLNQETRGSHWIQILYFRIDLLIFGISVSASRVHVNKKHFS